MEDSKFWHEIWTEELNLPSAQSHFDQRGFHCGSFVINYGVKRCGKFLKRKKDARAEEFKFSTEFSHQMGKLRTKK